MLRPSRLAFAGVLFAALNTAPAQLRAEPACPVDRPVVFAGLDWQSNAFHTEVARLILEEGYGCETDVIPGSTLPLLTGMGRGDIDITMEVWLDNVTKPWEEALERGTVVNLGTNFPDANQGWFVPRYVIEGDAERGIEPMAPELSHVRDLARHKQLFRDPEEPDKGRFLNCILGWQCEVNNTGKLKGYGLDDDFTNFRPGSGAALSAAIASAYRRGEPVLAYYWGPTWVLGSFDLVKLEEPPYTEEAWQAFSEDPLENPPVAFPTVEVVIGANAEFVRTAPEIAAFLRRYETTNALVSEALSYLQENPDAKPREAAVNFLRTQPGIWTDWVAPEAAERVRQALGLEGAAAPDANFPAAWRIPLDRWTDEAVADLVENYGAGFEAVSNVFLAGIVLLERGLMALPWWLVVLATAALAWHATRRVVPTVVLAAMPVLIGMLGLWDFAMQTLALTAVSVLVAVAIGLPVGIGLSRSERARKLTMPVLDAMQTMPSFVYLVPALMLFGLGKVPAVFATVIYATPPLIRLTDLGLRQVDPSLVEAGADLGAPPRTQLMAVELPLALPSIMAGINQTIMMALAMVVIASMIGARGLGEEVLLGIQRLDVGRGLAAGVAIVALAIVFDRITQAYGRTGRPGADMR